MTHIEGPNLLDYEEDAAKANSEPMNVNQLETNKATLYHWEAS